MALLQKKPQVSTNAPLYTLGASRTFLVIGLGNPGDKYDGTRHNIGFAAIDNFALKNNFPPWLDKRDLKCRLTIQNIGGNRVILCKPTTFMNSSGEAAQALQHFYKVANSGTLAVYDDLAIPLGQLRTRLGGSDAGHNGVKSLTAHIGENYGRLRIGIGSNLSAQSDAADFVLKKFTKEERAVLPAVLQESAAIISESIFGGSLPHETRKVI